MPRTPKAKRSTTRSPGAPPPEQQRLQRVLAAAGLGSRRQCEVLIEAGRVEVDGQIVTKLGSTVNPRTDKIRVDGDLLKTHKLVYYAVHKPIGVVTTNRDPQGRPRVVDLVPPDPRVFPVGRLDRHSEGLILLTNDGELAQRLTHPRFGVRKVYRVTVAGKVDVDTMRQMRSGIHIAEGFVKVEGAKRLKTRSRSTELEIVLREGKNREIRRILARLGHKVQHLKRVAVGPLRLGDVPPGAYRVLRRDEVDKLWAATEPDHQASADPPGQRRRSAKRGPAQGNSAQRGAARKKGGAKRSGAGQPKRRSQHPSTVAGPPAKAQSSRRTPAAGAESPLGGKSRRGVVIGGESEAPPRKRSATKKRKR